jgi:SulP family sulfate permease
LIVTTSQQHSTNRRFFFQGFVPLKRSTLSSEILAGLVLAAVGIPEVMGYTKIAGTPVATGLYTFLLPAIAFAVLGSSRHLVVAADSATAAILAANLANLATPGSPQYVALAGMVALVAAGFLILARLFQLGFLADFLSQTVLIGFLTGIGIQVVTGQLGALLGLSETGQGSIQHLTSVFPELPKLHWPTVGISLVVLAVILLCEKFWPKSPGALVAVVGAIVASWSFNWASYGVKIVGPIPGGLPSLGLPAVSLGTIPSLLGVALSCCLVIIAQSAATSRAFALRYNEPFSENVDLLGLAAANVAAGMSGTFIVNGSPTKTAIVDGAGGRSQLAQIVTVAIVLIVVLFLTGPISYLPTAALAAIVFLIGIKLIDIRGLKDLFRTHRDEFYLAIFTAATVVFIGVREGILLAIALSLILHVRDSYRPHSSVLVRDENYWVPLPVHPGSMSGPEFIVYRFSRDIFYANASRFSEEILMLVESATSPVHWFILEARAITEIDYSAAQAIRTVVQTLAKQNITFVITGLAPEVKSQFDRDGLTELIGPDHFYNRLGDSLKVFRKLQKSQGVSPPHEA